MSFVVNSTNEMKITSTPVAFVYRDCFGECVDLFVKLGSKSCDDATVITASQTGAFS